MKLVECPRDAMQGLPGFIPTAVKIDYLNRLLRVGFDTIDFGSFVSPKAIPQLRDTAAVLAGLDPGQPTKLLAIVANRRGAEQGCGFESVTYLGFPLSVSETFQQRNTRASVAEALAEVATIQNLCLQHAKTLVVYLSMGFGNPYGDPYHPETVAEMVGKLAALDIRVVAPADTVGSATPEGIQALFGTLIPAFPQIEFGAHLHSTPATVPEKLAAAYRAGCRRFDGAIRGFGGCPMAEDQLTGNLPTEQIIAFLEGEGLDLRLDQAAFGEAYRLADWVFA
ncbi:MAG: hydroxymethylglutaryl-CoA lyase [Ferruginibacter sp.]|nr:hydroxymethylglutaryl-CoA lyase [Cytophagales bacterium]